MAAEESYTYDVGGKAADGKNYGSVSTVAGIGVKVDPPFARVVSCADGVTCRALRMGQVFWLPLTYPSDLQSTAKATCFVPSLETIAFERSTAPCSLVL